MIYENIICRGPDGLIYEKIKGKHSYFSKFLILLLLVRMNLSLIFCLLKDSVVREHFLLFSSKITFLEEDNWRLTGNN